MKPVAFILKSSPCLPAGFVSVDVRTRACIKPVRGTSSMSHPAVILQHDPSTSPEEEKKQRKHREGTWTSIALQILSHGVRTDGAPGGDAQPADAPIIHLLSERGLRLHYSKSTSCFPDLIHIWINQQSAFWSQRNGLWRAGVQSRSFHRDNNSSDSGLWD